MDKHPIGDLMETTMQKIREMVDVNTIIGNPIVTADGITLIPVSKVSFGFASGGTDFQTKNQQPGHGNSFGGGSGAGVHIVPVAFLVVKDGNVRLLSITPPANTTIDRVIELVPEVIDKINDLVKKDKSE
ncbi:MAG: sporulation protein YtfJ [Clostridiales bacterium]|nr:sporulation protein YtfJ [Clostridiales bacterium]